MAEDWAVDVKKYVPDADDQVIKAIVRYCGIALRNRDSSLVSFSDKAETDRVKKNFCRKKMAMTDPDDVLDAGIAAVGERMKADRTKNRVTVYYLLAEHFGKLGLFGGATGGTAAGAAAGAALAAVGAAAAAKPRKTAAKVAAPKAATAKAAAPAKEAATKATAKKAPASKAAVAAAAPAAAAMGLMAAAPAAPAEGAVAAPASAAPAAPAAAPAAAHSDADRRSAAALQPDSGGFLGFAAIVFAGLALIVFATMLLGQYIGSRGDAPPPPPVVAAPAPAPAPVVPAPVIPDGAGVVGETVNGKPKVSVYFDTGKANIAPDFAAAVAPVKAWADANPDARFAVSGFNDPTGNAALNAELSKNRAQAVAAALAEQGVAADRIDLVKPADTTATDTDLAQARRVEIVVQ